MNLNLQDQIGVLEAGVDQLIQAVEAAHAAFAAHASDDAGGMVAATDVAEASHAEPDDGAAHAAAVPQPGAEDPLALVVARPSPNEITMTINGNTVVLTPPEIGQLVEMLSNARAAMQPEPPETLAEGWNFVSTRNPAMIVQKQPNGERLLILRHTGHGWVPFTFSPENALQIYMLLTQR